MRVAMISELPDDLSHPTGGVEAVAASLIPGLLAAGVDLHLIRFGASRRTSVIGANCPVSGIPRRWPAPFTNWAVTPLETRRLLDHIKPDVVHLQGIPELYRGSPIPSVVTIHGISFRDVRYRAGRLGQPLAWLLEASLRESLRNHRAVIVISPYVRQELTRYAHVASYDIANPVEDVFFQIRRRPEPYRVLYLGVLSRRKNIVGLVEAAARVLEQLPHAKFRFAGPWLDGHDQAVYRAMRNLRIPEGAFSFLGSLTRSEICAELESCTCQVLPSFQETAPIAVEEAMAAGVPVIASRTGGLPWMIDHGRTGLLFDAHDLETLSKHLMSLLTEPLYSQALGNAARDIAKARFRLGPVVQRTLEIYQRATAS